MKKYFLAGLVFMAISAVSCSGNKSSQTEKGEDTLYKYSDTSKLDTASKDTARRDAYEDSTSNAPRMPGGH